MLFVHTEPTPPLCGVRGPAGAGRRSHGPGTRGKTYFFSILALPLVCVNRSKDKSRKKTTVARRPVGPLLSVGLGGISASLTRAGTPSPSRGLREGHGEGWSGPLLSSVPVIFSSKLYHFVRLQSMNFGYKYTGSIFQWLSFTLCLIGRLAGKRLITFSRPFPSGEGLLYQRGRAVFRKTSISYMYLYSQINSDLLRCCQ